VKAELLLAVLGGSSSFQTFKRVDAILRLMLTCEVSHKQTTKAAIPQDRTD
jgi:hypothetical protein